MPRAQLGHLPHELAFGRGAIGLRQGGFYLFGPVPGNDDHLPRLQLGGCVQHMLHQPLVRELLQDLGRGAFHARAFAGGEDDDVDFWSGRHV